MVPTLLRVLVALLVLSPALACAETPLASYPLDGIDRVLDTDQPLPCESGSIELASYRGTTLRYARPVRAHPAFVAKLVELERIVAEVSIPFYGRAPRKLVHFGAYNCRRMRRYPTWVSEHALGNALDLAGFDFGPLRRSDPAAQGLDPRLLRPFSVRLDAHWRQHSGLGLIHARYLHELARRLIARPDLFPVVLGPAWPGHENHLHLDHAPYRVIEVFDATISAP